MNQKEKVTCSFSMDRELYNTYKGIVAMNGENVKGNLVRYMQSVVEYRTPNADTILAMKEVKALKADTNKKTNDSFAELLREVEGEMDNEH